MRKLPIPFHSVLGIIKLDNAHHIVEVVFWDGDEWVLQYDARIKVDVVKWGYQFKNMYKHCSIINNKPEIP